MYHRTLLWGFHNLILRLNLIVVFYLYSEIKVYLQKIDHENLKMFEDIILLIKFAESLMKDGSTSSRGL